MSSQDDDDGQLGCRMHALVAELYPICRSITGNGVRRTLEILCRQAPLRIVEVPTGTQVFDWTVPKEWNVREAYIENEAGDRVIDFARHNLHLVGYPVPVNCRLSLAELQPYLHSLPDQPDAIPYVTSYYKERWGFCSHRERSQLKDGQYRVVIDSDLKDGSLTYGELVLPGQSTREVFLSTYVCHPSMANNELSGPVVMIHLAEWLASQPRRFTYRIAFVPETIGAITYLSQHLDELKRNVEVGFNLSCIGDEGGYSYVASRYGKTLADRIAAGVLRHMHGNVTTYSFLRRGSDERQYCSSGVDLPLVTLCRSKFSEYPEYHTSLDNLAFVTPAGLAGGFDFVRRCVQACEVNRRYRVTCLGEPQLGRRGLYPTLSSKGSSKSAKAMMNLIAYADGTNDLLSIAEIIDRPVWDLHEMSSQLIEAGVLEELVE